MPRFPRSTAAQKTLAGRLAAGRLLTLSESDPFDRDALALAEQSAGVGVWTIDLTTGLVRATPQFFRIMGLEPTPKPVPMAVVRALRHPEDRDRVVEGFRRALDGGADSYEIEYRIVRPDGELRWIFGRGRVVRDAAGKPARYSGVDLDITDRKNAEQALATAKEALERLNAELERRVEERTAELAHEAQRRNEAESKLAQAQKMEAVGQLTGGIAHDFNNILQVIVGNLEIAKRLAQRAADADLRDGMLHALDSAQRAARNAALTVHRLLAFSRRQPLSPTPHVANGLVVEMAQMIAHTLGETIDVTTSLASDLWPIFADRNQLQTALLNLVVNARDAMPDGGRLTIETANATLGATSAPDVPPGDYVHIRVADTGVGIAREHLSRVFDPFFSTKGPGKGSGLGLSMVYGFVRQSGGQVRIDSEPGFGTTVHILLPRSESLATQARVSPAEATHASLPRARDGETILVVEDYEAARELGASALEGLGYRVLQAPDGVAAMRIVNGTEAPRIDLLFTDVVLPGGMSGRALADALRARLPKLPVLFATGYSPDVVAGATPTERGGRLLGKPYTLEALAAGVRQALDGD